MVCITSSSKLVASVAMVSLLMVPVFCFARSNSLTGGFSVSFDLSNRNNETVADDPDTAINEADQSSDSKDEYRRVILSPMVQFKSLSERDSFELRLAPGLKYDFVDSETDWDSDFYVAADRYITKSWQLKLENQFTRTDYYNPSNGANREAADPVDDAVASNDPPLSADLGRNRYWQNNLNVSSNNYYWEDSLFQLGYSYIALRNDDTGVGGYDDYDRHTVNLLNDHRFTSSWKTSLDLRFVRGDFDPADRLVVESIVDELAPDAGITVTDDQLSNDLNEYRLLLNLENGSIANNPLFLYYNYIGSKYDEVLRNDSDIHQLRFTWKHEFSPQLYTNLGAGPSYEKSEGRDGNWGGNGTLEMNYTMQNGSLIFLLDKRYDVSNFSGNNERGYIDVWDTSLSYNQSLLEDLNLNSFLSYVYEDREDPAVAIGRIISADDPGAVIDGGDISQLDKYTVERYVAGIGVNYTFFQFYSTGVNYTFTKRKSDRIGDDYDDHRVLFTLSWNKELFRW